MKVATISTLAVAFLASSTVDQANGKFIYSDSGIVVTNNRDAITAGPRGPLLTQDWLLFEKLAHFSRERIPERVVHTKGAGAFGTFTVTKDITDLTFADVFSKVGKKTKILARFSRAGSERGAADATRDVVGFALKFYTKKGNWDIVGNNTPVFFVRDPWKFPDLIRSVKRDPRSDLPNGTSTWDFFSLTPESLNQVTILFSDGGIPFSLRHTNGHGSHTFSLINAKNERTWVKFHWFTDQGLKFLTNAQAERVIGKSRESAQADLFNSIEKGDFPKWTLKIQTMTPKEADELEFSPFDVTKEWPMDRFPAKEVGYFELNKNPDNHFAQMEMASFSPGHTVPGVGFSPDRMLQFRTFSYPDAQRYRLGVNYEMLPVNRPIFEVENYHRDGFMRLDDNAGSDVNYEPNSFGGPVADGSLEEPPLPLDGMPATRYNQSLNNGNDFDQPGALYRSYSDAQQKRLIGNLVAGLTGIPENIQRRQIALFKAADSAWGEAVEKGLDL